jgi:hypothetical protein
MKATMKHYRQPARLALSSVLMLVVLTSLVTFGAAAEVKAKPPITIAGLAGPWQVAVVGNTGCGISSMLFTGTLNAQGKSTGTLTFNSGCGLSTTTESFNILSLNANGSGTAGLTCGSSCGWIFNIQVSPSRQVFNMVDVTDPDNWLAGSAVRK